MVFLSIYLVFINLAAFFAFVADKVKAKKHRWRIPEATLMGLAALGGGLGAWIAMYTVRHKTRHLLFVLGVPAILFVELALGVFLYLHFGG